MGPYTNAMGTLISILAPVRDEATEKMVAVLAIDEDTSRWRKDVAEYRLGPIVATFLVSMLLIGFFVTQERSMQTAEQVASGQRRLEEAQEIAHVGSWTYDPRTAAATWSRELLRILGFDPGTIEPVLPVDPRFVHPDDWPANHAAIQKALLDGGAYEGEMRIRRPNSTVRHVLSKWAAKRSPDGSIARVTGTMQDVTERIQMEEALKNARDLLEEKVEARTQELRAAQSRLVMHEKMASVGQLAAGIVHEISNPVGFVSTNFSTLQDDILVFKKTIAAYRDLTGRLGATKELQAELDSIRRLEESTGLRQVLDHIDKLFQEKARDLDSACHTTP